jgi:hypothetical protein
MKNQSSSMLKKSPLLANKLLHDELKSVAGVRPATNCSKVDHFTPKSANIMAYNTSSLIIVVFPLLKIAYSGN